MLSFRLKKQNSKNVADTIFKGGLKGGQLFQGVDQKEEGDTYPHYDGCYI